MAEENKAATVAYNGKDYKVNDLSKEVREQMLSLRFVEGEIRRLQAQLAIAQTARNAYRQTLESKLPSGEG